MPGQRTTTRKRREGKGQTMGVMTEATCKEVERVLRATGASEGDVAGALAFLRVNDSEELAVALVDAAAASGPEKAAEVLVAAVPPEALEALILFGRAAERRKKAARTPQEAVDGKGAKRRGAAS